MSASYVMEHGVMVNINRNTNSTSYEYILGNMRYFIMNILGELVIERLDNEED